MKLYQSVIVYVLFAVGHSLKHKSLSVSLFYGFASLQIMARLLRPRWAAHLHTWQRFWVPVVPLLFAGVVIILTRCFQGVFVSDWERQAARLLRLGSQEIVEINDICSSACRLQTMRWQATVLLEYRHNKTLSLLLGPLRMSAARDGAGRGARSENVGWPTGSKCVFVSLLCRHTHSNISRISWWGLCRECCFIAPSTGSIDYVIWTFDHSVWKMLCLWAKRYRRIPLKSHRFSSPRWSAPMPSDFVSLLSSDLDLNSPNSLYSKGKTLSNVSCCECNAVAVCDGTMEMNVLSLY